jgi:hypothetical protein
MRSSVRLLPAFPDGKVDALTAHRIVCCTYGHDNFGIFAVGLYAARHGLGDGFLAWMVGAKPNLRASCRAFASLHGQENLPPPPPGSRVAVFARLAAAANEPTSEVAVRETLRAWADAADATQARAAATQTRALLDGSPLHPLLPVLSYDPMPPALARGLADAIERQELQHAILGEASDADLPSCVAAIALLAKADKSSADLLRVADAAAVNLAPEVRVYLTLPVAARLIQQLDLDSAAARLDAAKALDTSGAQRDNIERLLAKCRAGQKP